MKTISSFLNKLSRSSRQSEPDYFDQRLTKMAAHISANRRARPSEAPSAFRSAHRHAIAH